MTYSDWQEPLRLLELSIGPPTSGQRALANQFGLLLNGNESYGVAGVMLEDRLMPLIWDEGAVSELASERQRNFLRSLGAVSVAQSASLTKRVASAWIDHQLAVRTAEQLRRLRLKAGDAVIKRTVSSSHPDDIAVHEALEFYYVSSIGADGLVYFKGGNGKCGWPSTLRLAEQGESPALYPRMRVVN
jgi:hypothetical protein